MGLGLSSKQCVSNLFFFQPTAYATCTAVDANEPVWYPGLIVASYMTPDER